MGGIIESYQIFQELEAYEQRGISFSIGAKTSSLNEVLKKHLVKEEGNYHYMRDYIYDENGNLIAVHFDHITI